MSRAMMPHRVYTVEFKTEAVKLAQEVGGDGSCAAVGYSGLEHSELDEAELRGQVTEVCGQDGRDGGSGGDCEVAPGSRVVEGGQRNPAKGGGMPYAFCYSSGELGG